MTVSSRFEWLLFIVLGFMWGSSYLFIKIGVENGLEPFTLITLRLAIGALLLAAIAFAARERMPRGLREYGKLFVLGFFGIALPFSLITSAEQSVGSSVAAVLASPVPLFVIPFAAVLLPDERLTANKVLGMAVGLAGVAILVGLDLSQLGSGNLIAELALLGSAVSYAIGGVYARRYVTGYRPIIPALFEVTTALVMISVLAFVFERPLDWSPSLSGVFSVAWLGVIGSGLAFLTYFRLLGRWGAARTSLVAYLLPVWGILLGTVVLGEVIAPNLIVGTVLVIGGIALVNIRNTGLVVAANRIRGRAAGAEAVAAVETVADQR